MISSSSSLATVSKLRLVIGHRMVPIGTSHLWLLRVRTHYSSASIHLPLLFGARSGPSWRLLPPHHPGQSLGPGGAVSAPKGNLQAGSTFFAGLLQPFVFYQEGLGVVAASIKSRALVCKIHQPEGSVSACSDASVIWIVSSVHGVRQSLPILGSLPWSLRGSAGLHAGHGSSSEFSPQSWIGFGLLCTTG